MNINKIRTEKCRHLLAELNWNKAHARQSARIAASQAIWLGLEKQDVLQLVRSIPSANYLCQCPHIFHETWAALSVFSTNQPLNEFEQLLNAAD
jgi:hypothetical protein